jgi:hypothetical protein
MSLIHNERIKLTATWLNTLAAASVVTGAIAPLVAIILGVQASSGVSTRTLVFSAAAWLLIGVGLHLVAS